MKPHQKIAVEEEDDDLPDVSDSYSTYLEYNKVLRTWFVAFGVGGPALFLVNESAAKRLAAAGELKLVVALFLLGTGAQVLGAFVNKVANWYVAHSNHAPAHAIKFKIAERVAEQFWIDILVDVLTIIVFGWAAWLLLSRFAAGV